MSEIAPVVTNSKKVHSGLTHYQRTMMLMSLFLLKVADKKIIIISFIIPAKGVNIANCG